MKTHVIAAGVVATSVVAMHPENPLENCHGLRHEAIEQLISGGHQAGFEFSLDPPSSSSPTGPAQPLNTFVPFSVFSRTT